ncbi:hypothetical protein BRD03_12125 [Halobacteriales archaeon QS_9_68_17]|nr:MAG: hypothetical protein BRD03_12125 [Halobacteriales archaeon QS_9_68_17]
MIEEVSDCVEDVTTLDGDVSVRTYGIPSRRNDETLAGHPGPAAVFADEVHLRAFERAFDWTPHEPTRPDPRPNE